MADNTKLTPIEQLVRELELLNYTMGKLGALVEGFAEKDGIRVYDLEDEDDYMELMLKNIISEADEEMGYDQEEA
jgi:hypothetical protein